MQDEQGEQVAKHPLWCPAPTNPHTQLVHDAPATPYVGSHSLRTLYSRIQIPCVTGHNVFL